LLVLLGVGLEDDETDVEWLCQKTAALRIFNDSEGVMNRSVMDIDGEVLLISQFTLHASTKKEIVLHI
jgi:D-tyrosyl-tRNA(Tyr) deacylase